MKALFYPDVPFETLMIPHILKEIYFDHVYNDILKGSDMTIVDVGANIGLVTQYMRPFAKIIYAIEPSPLEAEALQKNKEFNEWENVEVFTWAIADKDGEMEFSINSFNRTMNSLILPRSRPPYEYPDRLTIHTKRLDNFFHDENIGQVDFMKFDVEGAEDMILRSEGFLSVADRIKAVEVEFHSPDWEDLSKFMLSLGYHGRRYKTDAIIVLYERK
jgi:FkbM family methyltransferase